MKSVSEVDMLVRQKDVLSEVRGIEEDIKVLEDRLDKISMHVRRIEKLCTGDTITMADFVRYLKSRDSDDLL